MFEQENKVSLTGRIGAIKKQNVAGIATASFSILTQRVYKATDGSAVISCTHTPCRVLNGKDIDVESLSTGLGVHAEGWLENRRYTDSDGTEHSFLEVIVRSLEVIDE